MEWRLVKAQLQDFAGQLQEAEQGFREFLEIQPLSVRALQVLIFSFCCLSQIYGWLVPRWGVGRGVFIFIYW
jgi:hypothetical protein